MSDLGTLVQTLGTSRLVDTTGASWLDSSWWAQLQPGSWRGVGFVMDGAEVKTGRRVAIHEYPYRDTIWVEDLGKLPRRFAFQAFLVGDDCYQQRDSMVAACEKAGSGTLVHPTMGSVECFLIDFTTTDRRERGRMVEIAFQFVISGDISPTATVATGANVLGAADALDTAAATDLSSFLDAGTSSTSSDTGTAAAARGATLATSTSSSSKLPPAACDVVDAFTAIAVAGVNDATRALNAVRGLQGYFGRYAAGSRATMLPASATVASVLSGSITTRTAVLAAATAVEAAADALVG